MQGACSLFLHAHPGNVPASVRIGVNKSSLSAAQARLVQLFAAKELGMDKDMLSYRLRQLTLLLPDMSA